MVADMGSTRSRVPRRMLSEKPKRDVANGNKQVRMPCSSSTGRDHRRDNIWRVREGRRAMGVGVIEIGYIHSLGFGGRHAP